MRFSADSKTNAIGRTVPTLRTERAEWLPALALVDSKEWAIPPKSEQSADRRILYVLCSGGGAAELSIDSGNTAYD